MIRLGRARAMEHSLGHDTLASAETAELERLGILPPPVGAVGPPIEGWRLGRITACPQCYPDADPPPTRYVWDGQQFRLPDYRIGDHAPGFPAPTADDFAAWLAGENPPGWVCRHGCHYIVYA